FLVADHRLRADAAIRRAEAHRVRAVVVDDDLERAGRRPVRIILEHREIERRRPGRVRELADLDRVSAKLVDAALGHAGQGHAVPGEELEIETVERARAVAGAVPGQERLVPLQIDEGRAAGRNPHRLEPGRRRAGDIEGLRLNRAAALDRYRRWREGAFVE